MNVETANRLVQLRKERGFSQEELAEKLQISRQAVSKWERAEASPDTDNLIMLARLYGVSLDELLGHEVPADGQRCEQKSEPQEPESEDVEGEKRKNTKVDIGTHGILVEDGNDVVHIGFDGIRVDKKHARHAYVGRENGKVEVVVAGKKYSDNKWQMFPFGAIVAIVFVLLGALKGAWHPAWLLFLTIPLYHSLISAVQKRRASAFAYPVLAILIFLCAGIFFEMWHPGWVVFLTIPIYYAIFKSPKKCDENKECLDCDGCCTEYDCDSDDSEI
ncbi:MAG: helix-turn-helix domain-containing protein [Oscillospiraceae bacterium]